MPRKMTWAKIIRERMKMIKAELNGFTRHATFREKARHSRNTYQPT